MSNGLLEGLRVLLVEDESIIALDIAQSLERAGADVVGPARTVAKALDLIGRRPIDVAVLDYRLENETTSPVAARLTALGIPFLFHTSSPGAPRVAHPDVPVIEKPTRPGQLAAAVLALTSKR